MKTDVAIVGGGPGGAACSMFLTAQGLNSVLIERQHFPRFHIGESMTGECGGVVRALGMEQLMTDYGHPIKRGVKVFGTGGKNSWFVPVMMRDKDWNLSEIFTWQVRRSVFDQQMQDEAVKRGATLIHGQAVDVLRSDEGKVCGVKVRLAEAEQMEIEADMVVDASGQGTFLANVGVVGPKYRGNYDKQIAIFSQVEGAIRDEGPHRDDTLIFYQQKYHWSWFIPLDDEVVSVGVVVPAAYLKHRGESKRDFLVRELHELNPELKQRLPSVELLEVVRAIPNYSYQVRHFAGPGFLCIGDAHRFIDPIFSFGLYVTLKEAQFAAQAIGNYLAGENRDAENPFAEYVVNVEKGIDIIEDVVDTFWEHPLAFAFFVHERYRSEMIDVFAGRVYERQPSVAVEAMRKMLDRSRGYSAEDLNLLSMPIGSRFHPERAPIWRAESMA